MKIYKLLKRSMLTGLCLLALSAVANGTAVQVSSAGAMAIISSKSSTIPIRFARGTISATVTGKLAGFDSEQSYSIVVGKGQTMTVEQLNAGNKRTTLWLTDPKGEDVSDADLSCNNKKKVSPTIAGTYTIKVIECMKADPWKGRYTLKVTVR